MRVFYISLVVLLFLVIFIFTINNISYASVNADDLKTYANQALSNYFIEHPGDVNNASSKMWVIYRWVNSSAYETTKETLTNFLSSYNNIVVKGINNTSNHSVSIYGLNSNTIFNLNNTSLVNSTNTSYIDFKVNSQEYNDLTNWNTSYTSTSRTQRANSTLCYTNEALMFFETNFNSNNNVYYGYNYSSFINAHNINFTGNNYVADVKVGEAYNLDNITYKLYFLSDNTKVYNTGFSWQVFYQDGIQGKVGELSIRNMSKIKSNNYYLEMYNSGDLLCTSNQFSITYDSTGEITNTSGENTGTIDLSGISSGINNVNNSINQQGENITNAIIKSESGDIERDNFWKNTYNSLFTLTSGDVNDIYLLTTQYFPSGDYSPLGFFDKLFGFGDNNEPEDFIISWDDIYLGATSSGELIYDDVFIHSSSINFSELCRDNETFGTILSWVRVLSSLAVFTIFLFGIYYGVLDMLGVLHPDDFTKEEHKTIIGFTMDR